MPHCPVQLLHLINVLALLVLPQLPPQLHLRLLLVHNLVLHNHLTLNNPATLLPPAHLHHLHLLVHHLPTSAMNPKSNASVLSSKLPPNPTSTLHHLHHEQPHTCSLHSGGPHPIISCAILWNICNQTSHFDALNNTRNDRTLPPMPSSGLLLSQSSHCAPSPSPAPRVQNPYVQPRAPPQQEPIGARCIFDNIDQHDPTLYSQSDVQQPDDDTPLPVCPLVPPPGFDDDHVSIEDNFSIIPCDPYILPSFPTSILNPPCSFPKKSVRFSLPPTSCLVSCRYIPSCSSPFSSLTSSHSSFIRAVCDSGASHTMTSHVSLFSNITYFDAASPRPHALMGDDSTKLTITGYGYISVLIHGHRLHLFSYFVTGLGATLLSVKQYMRTQGCYFHAEAKNTILAYPTFLLYPRVAAKIDLLLSPSPSTSTPYDFDKSLTRPLDINQASSSSSAETTHHSTKLTLISPSIQTYITQPSLQLPFTHTLSFHHVLPTAPLPHPVTCTKGCFTASSAIGRTLQPGMSVCLPTGLRANLPPGVVLHTGPLPSFHHPGLQIIDTPSHNTCHSQISLQLSNVSSVPIVIPSGHPIATFHFTHNCAILVPHKSHSPSPDPPTIPPLSPVPSPPCTFSLSPGFITTTVGTSSITYKARRVSRPDHQRHSVIAPSNQLPDPATLYNSNIVPATTPQLIHHTPIDPKTHISPGPSLTSPRSPLPSDSVNAALPKVVTMTRKCLLQSIGFRCPKSILNHMKSLASTPISIQQDSSPCIIVQLLASDILDHDPSLPPAPSLPSPHLPHLPWIHHNAISTLFLPDQMRTPKQGFLKLNNNEWAFHLGRDVNKTKHPLIPLPNFIQVAESLVHNKKLFPGRKTNSFVLNARHCRSASNVISHLIFNRKVTAANLHTLKAPTLLNHSKLHPDDKTTWDAAYKSEYDGLVNIETWETITEAQYQSMKHLYQGIMPTMAISTIKYDGQGNPNHAKYCIVALGNLDPHSWTKSDCFAPVLSQLELRFLTALAVRKRCIPKTGNVTQAFCQSSLPPDEHYICRPPPGCPITPPNSYWRLKKTLYGLKRSPRHFYMLARKLLLQLGLKQHPTSPCIFSGTIIKGEPPLYLGLYVNDFIYFSESAKVESTFEEKFGKSITTDFNGQIGYFLGINFTCTRHDDGAVSIHLGQEAFIENLCQIANLDNPHVALVHTPYRSGCTVDSILHATVAPDQQSALTHKMQVLIGCLTWLSISTCPDIATITNLLAQYTTKATNSHLNQAKRVIKYLRTTKTLGISFHSDHN
jgi:hypothetical protein